MSATVAAIVGLMLYPAASPAQSSTSQGEILYLLGFVQQSGCQFYRNGSWYDSRRASQHLRDKYNVLSARGQITTAEDFIEKVATASSLTGKPYMVRCSDGTVIATGQWLGDELTHYRNGMARH